MSTKTGPQPYNSRLLKPNSKLGYARFGDHEDIAGSEQMPDDALYLRAVTPTVPKGGARKKKVIRKKKKSLVKKKKSVTKKKKSVTKKKKSSVCKRCKKCKCITCKCPKRKKTTTKKKKTKRKKSTRR
jgi:hypothetical protein